MISATLDLIVLQDRLLRCVHLREDEPIWLRIPPGVPHGASDPRDDQPGEIPMALAQVWSELQAA